MTDMRSAAMALAQRGMAVFPLKPRGKLPITKHGCLDATVDLQVVSAWWKGGPELNIGIATGTKSGLWVLDIDPDKGGEKSLAEIEQRHAAKLAQTVEVVTGSGGRHLYFKWPDFEGAPAVKNSAGMLGPGLDVRGAGGYVVAPPSIHPDTKRPYSWSVDSGNAIIEAPIWFLTMVAPQPATRNRPADYFASLSDGVAEGRRNDSAASLAVSFSGLA